MNLFRNCFIIAPLALLFACGPTIAKDQAPSSQAAETAGQLIQSTETYNVDLSNGNKSPIATAQYDDNGNRTKVYKYKGQETTEENYEYNADGNITKYTQLDAEGKVTYTNVSIYEGANMVEERNDYGTTKTQYNERGEIIGIQEYDSEGELDKEEKMIYEYRYELVAKIETYAKRGAGDFQLQQEQLFSYNQQDLVEKETSRAVFGTYEYSYDYHPNGKTKEKTTLAYGGDEKVVTQYDEGGRRISEHIYRRKSAEEAYQLDLNLKWVYDQHGNEVKAERFRNGQVESRKIREITYR